MQLKDEVELTLKCLEKCRDGGFEEIFATKIDHAAKYDYCIRYASITWYCFVVTPCLVENDRGW